MNKLYEKNSYLKECAMKVLSLDFSDDKYMITVDQSIFFPEEGGQYADTGLLYIEELPGGYDGPLKVGDTSKLLDGQISDGIVRYYVDVALPQGCLVKGILDWDKRFMRMQNHSGEHVLTGVIHNEYGFNNVGFHLSDDGLVTLDLDGSLSYDQVIEMEILANEAVYKNYPIKDTYPDKQQLNDIQYRSKIEIEGQVRLITVGDEETTVDVCACCAPHVRSTGEIGIIKVISVINYKKGIQIGILCGSRALEYINNEHSMMTSISRMLSTSPENVERIVKSQIDEIAGLKISLSAAIENSLIREIEEMGEDCVGCIFTNENLTANNMKNIYNVLVERINGNVGIFVGDDESGYRYNAGGRGVDATILGKLMRDKLSAKGGGSSEMIQGRVNATKESIIDFFQNN